MSELYLIAEIGINHNGNIDDACAMIDVAADSGWNAVKFQKRTIDACYSQEELARPRESPWGTTTRAQKEGLEFGKEEYDVIKARCADRAIDWFASAWDMQSFEFLEQFDPVANKVASAMLVDDGICRAVAGTKRLTYISTGMSGLPEICRTAEIFESSGCQYVLLHCVACYPVASNNADIANIRTLSDIFGISSQWLNFRGVGYSGHEHPTNSLPSLTAIALGARWIERHVTLDRDAYGSDQKASMEPDEMRDLRVTGDKVLTMLGSGKIEMKPWERPAAEKLRAHLK